MHLFFPSQWCFSLTAGGEIERQGRSWGSDHSDWRQRHSNFGLVSQQTLLSVALRFHHSSGTLNFQVNKCWRAHTTQDKLLEACRWWWDHLNEGRRNTGSITPEGCLLLESVSVRETETEQGTEETERGRTTVTIVTATVNSLVQCSPAHNKVSVVGTGRTTMVDNSQEWEGKSIKNWITTAQSSFFSPRLDGPWYFLLWCGVCPAKSTVWSGSGSGC